MRKILDYLKKSNRYKHLLGGFLVGVFALNAWTAVYSGIVAALCLELKDYLYGGRPEIADIVLTICGACAASVLWML